ncbi:MAG: ribosome silencing factor [Firmicutes bacterium]|nr:ribosome silencing factor [Bacillota bacterium]
MTNKDIAMEIAKALDAKKGQDIVIIDIAERSGFADYFVIADAGNSRLLEALADEAEEKMAGMGAELDHREGLGESGWILLDHGDIIINLFTKQQRDHYNIEKIWSDCDSIAFTAERK